MISTGLPKIEIKGIAVIGELDPGFYTEIIDAQNNRRRRAWTIIRPFIDMAGYGWDSSYSDHGLFRTAVVEPGMGLDASYWHPEDMEQVITGDTLTTQLLCADISRAGGLVLSCKEPDIDAVCSDYGERSDLELTERGLVIVSLMPRLAHRMDHDAVHRAPTNITDTSVQRALAIAY
jgi:hypothetical protein